MVYREVQSMTRNRIYLFSILLLPLLILWLVYGAVKQVVLGQSFGSSPVPNAVLLFIVTALMLLLWFFLRLSLVVEVTNNNLLITI
jgi:uncharacterized membrane protein